MLRTKTKKMDKHLVDPGGVCAKRTNCDLFGIVGNCTPEAQANYFACLSENDQVFNSIYNRTPLEFIKNNWKLFTIGILIILLAISYKIKTK